MKYLGASAPKVLAYGVASVSGTILVVCSCTILPLFAGIYRMGAGLGPAMAFLYSGPAINVLAIVFTASVLGPQLGLARAVGAVVFSIVIGLVMHLLFRKEELVKRQAQAVMPNAEESRPLGQTALYFAAMIGILVFANWGEPQGSSGLWHVLYEAKWSLTGGFALLLAVLLVRYLRLPWWRVALLVALVGVTAPLVGNPPVPFLVGLIGLTLLTSTREGEAGEWFSQSWGFAKQILPLLFWGVLLSGFRWAAPGRKGSFLRSG